MKRTLKQAKVDLRHLGLNLRKRDGEYRVAFPNDEVNAYYTNDLEDAVATGRAMASVKDRKWILLH